MRRICLLCVCLLAAVPASAATLVTWQADGSVTRVISTKLVPPEPGTPISPPVGTPLSITLSFDPSSAVPTPTPAIPGCVTLLVSGSATIGNNTVPIGASSRGFTNAGLPGTNCGGPPTNTEFGLIVPGSTEPGQYVLPAGLLVLSYRDLLVRDGFPNTPSPAFLADVSYREFDPDLRTVFEGKVTLRALDQPTAVPEPATLTLFGLGLAATIRRVRRR